MNLDLIAVSVALLFFALLLFLAEDKRHDPYNCKRRAEIFVLWLLAVIFLLLAVAVLLGSHLLPMVS